MRMHNLSAKLSADFRLLFCARDGETSRRLFQSSPYNVHFLPETSTPSDDVAFTGELARRSEAVGVIVDLLQYDDEYLRGLKQVTPYLVTFHENRIEDPFSDMMVNYNPSAALEGFVPKDARKYCHGTKYCIFNDSFTQAARRGMERYENALSPVKTVAISMGGSDPSGLTLQILRQLPLSDDSIRVEAHVGPAFKHRAELDEWRKNSPTSVSLHQETENLAAFFAKSGLVFCAGGNTLYELCLMGIPVISIGQNEHQDRFARELARQGAIRYLGKAGDLDATSISQTYRELLEDPSKRLEMVKCSESIFDPVSTRRLADEIKRALGI